MTSAAFLTAFAFTLDVEKGYVNHPQDAGGPTKYGITIRTLSSWRGVSCTAEDVQKLEIPEAQDIYFSRYWLVAGCDRVESLPISMALFDISVWSGPHTATLYAQIAMNEVFEGLLGTRAVRIVEDGKVGPSTIAGLSRISPLLFLTKYHDLLAQRQAAIIKKHPDQKVFENGWTSRIDRLLTLGSGIGTV